MKILVELPTWLGDAVMATPALESLFLAYPEAKITLFGSYAATEALKAHPRVVKVVVDKSKDRGFRALNIYKTAKGLGSFDLAISFRSHIYSKLLLFFTGSDKRYAYKKEKIASRHQVLRYQDFINSVTKRKDCPGPLKLYHQNKVLDRPTLGINPGATYGSAKRWYPEKFAEVAAAFADRFDIVIFGGPSERNIANEIETVLKKRGVENISNLAGKTDIAQLCSLIGGLDLFITGDSGPMHIAAAYKIPTVAIFGPTKHDETSQWMNEKSLIVRHDIECAPCMKRTCPLKTHECMKSIEAKEVIYAAKRLLS
ncbi:MAG: lipopolysaccharide heptosyltransferase II [Hydrogenimonas sp.]|nr:lipopolysaccharide heptosyltransferase II [Hydrogenimonas sp.]